MLEVAEGGPNVTRFMAKRVNCHRISRTMSEFSESINDLELVDSPLIGGSLTWRMGWGWGWGVGGSITVNLGLTGSSIQ